MRKLISSLLLLSSVYADIPDQNNTRSCSQITDDIHELRKEKFRNVSSRIATIFMGGGYVYGRSNNGINMKIRLLELERAHCK